MDVLVPLRDTSNRIAAYARIDPSSEWVRSYPWYRLTPDSPPTTVSDRLPRAATMAEVILGVVDDERTTVRYRNGDMLDNRLANLERVRRRAGRPRSAPSDPRPRYKRVLWDREHHAWVAYGYAGGKYVHLGRFDDELAAARAARAWSIEHQSIHLEDDFRAGGFGRALKPPSKLTEASRRKAPIGGKD